VQYLFFLKKIFVCKKDGVGSFEVLKGVLDLSSLFQSRALYKILEGIMKATFGRSKIKKKIFFDEKAKTALEGNTCV
jgi:hypothetical protein